MVAQELDQTMKLCVIVIEEMIQFEFKRPGYYLYANGSLFGGT